MKFDKDIMFHGERFQAGFHVNISYEQYLAMKDWTAEKSYKNFRRICKFCFNEHSWLYSPIKLFKVFKHTYIDGFYACVKDVKPVFDSIELKAISEEELASLLMKSRLAPAKYIESDDLNFAQKVIEEAARRLREHDFFCKD